MEQPTFVQFLEQHKPYGVFEDGKSDTGKRFSTYEEAQAWIDNIDPKWRELVTYVIRKVS